MANSVTLDISHILWFVGLLTTIFGVLFKLLVGQVEKRLDEKFSSMEEKFKEINYKFSKSEITDADNKLEQARIEKDLLLMRIEMSDKYVKSEALNALRSDLQETRAEISKGFEKLTDKLDTKVSKEDCARCDR